MNYNLVITQPAKKDLADILQYIPNIYPKIYLLQRQQMICWMIY